MKYSYLKQSGRALVRPTTYGDLKMQAIKRVYGDFIFNLWKHVDNMESAIRRHGQRIGVIRENW